MFELVERVNWNEYALILAQGDPPIGLQLLVVNALLAVFWFARRMFKPKPKKKRNAPEGSAWMVQLLFVAGNIGVIMLGGRLAF